MSANELKTHRGSKLLGELMLNDITKAVHVYTTQNNILRPALSTLVQK